VFDQATRSSFTMIDLDQGRLRGRLNDWLPIKRFDVRKRINVRDNVYSVTAQLPLCCEKSRRVETMNLDNRIRSTCPMCPICPLIVVRIFYCTLSWRYRCVPRCVHVLPALFVRSRHRSRSRFLDNFSTEIKAADSRNTNNVQSAPCRSVRWTDVSEMTRWK